MAMEMAAVLAPKEVGAKLITKVVEFPGVMVDKAGCSIVNWFASVPEITMGRLSKVRSAFPVFSIVKVLGEDSPT